MAARLDALQAAWKVASLERSSAGMMAAAMAVWKASPLADLMVASSAAQKVEKTVDLLVYM
jgi:hypothetical protein